MSFNVIATEPFEKKVKKLAKKHKSLAADLAPIFEQLAKEPTIGTSLGKIVTKYVWQFLLKGKANQEVHG